jgi:hypothetical protein
MHGTSRPHLDAEFLERVKRCYRLAIAAVIKTRGMWSDFDARRADVHAALLAESNIALREIFANPTTTDLYYGVDNLCRSITGMIEPSSFVEQALGSERAQHAIYYVQRLQELAGHQCSVVEIGPGMGRAAYYGYSAGIDYTTIDLPLGVVAQARFLGEAINPDAIWFEGENETPAEGRIKLRFSKPRGSFDVALNVDSLTEIPVMVALDYVKWLAHHAALFLSINHDKNLFTAAEVAAYSGAWHRRSSGACPVWRSYREEVFVPRKRGTLSVIGPFLLHLIARRRARRVPR